MIIHDKKTRRLAKQLTNMVGKPSIDHLYDCLKGAVYGMKDGSVIAAEDLVHVLAELLGKPDPSTTP